jgi:hypothetical protein
VEVGARGGQLSSAAGENARPLVSMEGFARFEQRARQKRIERRLAAARTAIADRQFAKAHAALDELREIDPLLPDLVSLNAALADAERARRTRPAFGALAAACLVFAAVALAARWTTNTGLLQSYPFVPVAALAPANAALVSGDIALDVPLATSGEAAADLVAIADVPAAAVPAPPPLREAPPSIIPVVPPSPLDAPPGAATDPIPPPVSEPVIAEPQPPTPPTLTANAVAPAVNTAPVAAIEQDDARLVRDVLQRYRAAYDRLDAAQARAVWPSVNQSALARAFEGLESQSLTFDACDVRLRGVTATAVCRGTTRYVPKVGSHEPRVEPLVWNFTLHKTASIWEIQTARAER